MPERCVRYQKQEALVKDVTAPLSFTDAVEKIKAMADIKGTRTYKGARKRKELPQSIDLVLHMGVDPKLADQNLRGAFSLPKSIGKVSKVIAFCEGALAEAAKAAGAIEVGSEDLIDKIQKGWTDFDVAVAHPSMMGKVGKLGKVLGPQGKMPSPKAGTVTADIATAVREYSAGKLEFRNDTGGNIHLPVGKTNTPTADVVENIDAVIKHMLRIKPASAKGQYLKKASLSGTRTPGVLLHVGE
jgi:large subunit ribosomal protein L1